MLEQSNHIDARFEPVRWWQGYDPNEDRPMWGEAAYRFKVYDVFRRASDLPLARLYQIEHHRQLAVAAVLKIESLCVNGRGFGAIIDEINDYAAAEVAIFCDVMTGEEPAGA
tara:strand:+ start:737 stop:1072 length:336 start_codon:yes stop_codon:yes gene_type:complete